MRMIKVSATLGVLGAMLAAPLVASADPPAVGAPTIPAVFVGAPTNDNPNAGEFTVNFDASGYRGIGTAPEPPLTRDLVPAPERVYRQASLTLPAASRTARNTNVDGLFVSLREQLREHAQTQTAMSAAVRGASGR